MIDLSFVSLHIIPAWLGVWTLMGAVSMGADKALAKMGERRISERTLHVVALVGGFVGIVIGAVAFHHKVSKTSFWPPVVLVVIIWAAFLYCVFVNPGAIGL